MRTAVGEGIGIYDEQTKAARAAKAKEQQNLDNSKAIMNNAANTQLSKVNNSVGLTAQQNKTNATVNSAVNTQIKNGGLTAAQASGSATTKSTTAAATTPAPSSSGQGYGSTGIQPVKPASQQIAEQKNTANTQQSTAPTATNGSGYDVTTKSGGTTFMQDENGNMVAYDVQEQVFTNPTTGNSATVRGSW